MNRPRLVDDIRVRADVGRVYQLLQNYQNALDRMRACGVNIISAESAVFEWMGDSKHEQFKVIQGWLR